jgi:hypothetical protein
MVLIASKMSSVTCGFWGSIGLDSLKFKTFLNRLKFIFLEFISGFKLS